MTRGSSSGGEAEGITGTSGFAFSAGSPELELAEVAERPGVTEPAGPGMAPSGTVVAGTTAILEGTGVGRGGGPTRLGDWMTTVNSVGPGAGIVLVGTGCQPVLALAGTLAALGGVDVAVTGGAGR